MAKDIIFDSERLERQQNRKRYLIPAAVLAGLVVLVVVIALVVRGSRTKPVTGGEGTDYPYVWTVNKNGSLSLEIDRAAAPGFQWVEEGSNALLTVTAEQDSANGKTRFTLTPKTVGRAVLVFSLQREEDESDRIFELAALAEVAEDGKKVKTSLLSVSGKPLFGVLRGGEETICPYFIRMDDDGDLMIGIRTAALPQEPPETEDGETDDKDWGWQCVCDDEAVAEVLGVIGDEETTVAYLRPGTTPGTARVRMADSVSGTEFTAELELSEDGSIRFLSHSIRTDAAPADTTD
jgi:hypothetical protein